MYPKTNSSPNFNELELKILDYWKKNKSFESSVENRKENENEAFVFYDGPPFANGLPHYGHLLSGYIKDVFGRYQTQIGKRVERRFGWDCHGLPAEMGAEKELGISGRINIIKHGIDNFNNTCKTSVLKYRDKWHEYVDRQARWVDFDNDYKTMDKSFMESVIWAFKELYKKGLVYRSMRVMPYSWACETPLSNFETRLDNSYRERADKAATVLFRLNGKKFENDQYIDEKLGDLDLSSIYIAAWTTTPWTLPSNLALAVGAELEYAIVKHEDKNILMAKSSLGKYKKELGENPEIIAIVKGADLYNLEYEPLLPYFKGHKNAFRVLVGDFVTEGDGTGIVHLAPGFGEDDQILCEKENIELVCPVDNAGKYTSEIDDLKGMLVIEANDEVIKKLKSLGLWLKTEQYIHNYPHCWRTDTPLIYKAVPSWYVEVTKFKDRMVELNQQINWIPGHVKNGIFGNWLSNARDWSISRNRFWGTPIPIWESDDPKYPRIDVYGSIEELEKDFGVKVNDLHRPYIDDLIRPNPDDPTGKSVMRRVEDVFDCWFESGSMPYGQVHYPFENKEKFEKNFPADFIVEYTAQTRGWFYTLMVLSTALFDKPPFLNCICHGVILDEKGQKLSKRLNNYADPLDIFKEFGSDSLRWFMLSSPAMRGQELLVDKSGASVKECQRKITRPLWNAYHFFCLYANADNITAKEVYESKNILDSYILSKLHMLIKDVRQDMDAYDTVSACERFESFVEILNNWYIRRNRPRFWKSEIDSDKQLAYDTLFTVLTNICRLIAPLMPMVSEEIYLGLADNDSVHLTNMPDCNIFAIDNNLIKEMDKVMEVCNSGHAVRNNKNIRTRQPLSALTIVGNLENLSKYADLIKDDVNVKSIEFESDIKKYAEYKLQILFPVFGKRMPTKVKDVISDSKAEKWVLTDSGLISIAGIELQKDEFNLLLKPHNSDGAEALSSQDALVVLDTNITQELLFEGIARDIIRAIQSARKDKDYDISDKVQVKLCVIGDVKEAAEMYKDYIQEQTLSNIEFSDNPQEISLDMENCSFSI